MKRVFSGIAASLFAAVFCLAGCTADPAREPVQEPMQPGGPVAEVPADPPGGEEDGLQVILVQSPMGEAEIVEETSNYIRYRAEANEGCALQRWEITTVSRSGEQHFHWQYSHQDMIGKSSDDAIIYIEPIFTSRTREPLPVEIVSVCGGGGTAESLYGLYAYDAGDMWLTVTPNEDSYLRSLHVQVGGGSVGDINIVNVINHGIMEGEQDGGILAAPFADSFEGPDKKVVAEFIAKDRACLARFCFDEEAIERTDQSYGYYAPSISDSIIAAERGEEGIFFSFPYIENLMAIYANGYQFAGWKDESGRIVTRLLSDMFAADRAERTYTMVFAEKPVADPLFDYTLNEDGTGYLLSVNRCLSQSELPETFVAPHTYNGLPVVGIAPQGFTYYGGVFGYADYSDRVVWEQ